MKIACILLAAGLGTRMGGDKLSTAVNGKTLIAHAVSITGTLPFYDRIAVIRPGDTVVCETVRKAGFRTVYNHDPKRGIASSIGIGLKDARRIPECPVGALFLVADQPMLTKQTVGAMMDLFARDPHVIVRPRDPEGRTGNPVLFPRELFDELDTLTGDTGGRAVIARHPELVRYVPCAAEELRDIDTPEDIGG